MKTVKEPFSMYRFASSSHLHSQAFVKIRLPGWNLCLLKGRSAPSIMDSHLIGNPYNGYIYKPLRSLGLMSKNPILLMATRNPAITSWYYDMYWYICKISESPMIFPGFNSTIPVLGPTPPICFTFFRQVIPWLEGPRRRLETSCSCHAGGSGQLDPGWLSLLKQGREATEPWGWLCFLSRWWVFQRFFLEFSHPEIWGKMNPIWRAYFSKGLVQPPTRYVFFFGGVIVVVLSQGPNSSPLNFGLKT